MKQEDIDFLTIRIDPKKEVKSRPKSTKDISIGNLYETRTSGIIEILEVNSSLSIKIRFVNTGYEKYTYLHTLKRGEIKDPYHRSVKGLGYKGEGKYSSYDQKTGKHRRSYIVWRAIIVRVVENSKPCYAEASVSKEWECYQNFAEWYENQPGHDLPGWEIEKDFLLPKNKLYSKETCCLLPKYLNCFIRFNPHQRGSTPLGVAELKTGKFRALLNFKGSVIRKPIRETYQEASEDYIECKVELIKQLSHELVKEVNPELHERISQVDRNHLEEMSK